MCAPYVGCRTVTWKSSEKEIEFVGNRPYSEVL